METSQFEAKKVALKQTKDGHVLTLAIHPDETPDELLRDYVGSRYMVVMVRLGDDEKPLNREEYAGAQMIKLAGMLCRDRGFWNYLYDDGQIIDKCEDVCVAWLTSYLGVNSRSEIKTNANAQYLLKDLNNKYKEWKNV